MGSPENTSNVPVRATPEQSRHGLRVCVININRLPETVQGCEAIAGTLRAIDPSCEVSIVHWQRFLLEHEQVHGGNDAFVLGPNGDPFSSYPAQFADFLGWLRAQRIRPMLGICGGHQALCLAHGAEVAPVLTREVAIESYAGFPKVTGMTVLRVLDAQDPLFEGLPDQFELAVSHVDEVKRLPPGFFQLASAEPAALQVVRRGGECVYGVQAHPEREASAQQGRLLLKNWLRCVARTRTADHAELR